MLDQIDKTNLDPEYWASDYYSQSCNGRRSALAYFKAYKEAIEASMARQELRPKKCRCLDSDQNCI